MSKSTYTQGTLLIRPWVRCQGVHEYGLISFEIERKNELVGQSQFLEYNINIFLFMPMCHKCNF